MRKILAVALVIAALWGANTINEGLIYLKAIDLARAQKASPSTRSVDAPIGQAMQAVGLLAAESHQPGTLLQEESTTKLTIAKGAGALVLSIVLLGVVAFGSSSRRSMR
jgi:hypothetical protein